MENFIINLKNKTIDFQAIAITSGNINSLIKEKLLSNPDVLSSLNTFAYSYVLYGSQYRLRFNVTYKQDKSNLTVIVKDDFELLTAITMILKSHKEFVRIIVDNEKQFTSKNALIQHIHDLEHLTGVEFELSQRSMTSSLLHSFLNEKLLVCELNYKYFDDANIVNRLSFVVAEHAFTTHYLNDNIEVIDYLLKWFRNNIKYRNNDKQSDHSAVGLIKNGTAVCHKCKGNKNKICMWNRRRYGWMGLPCLEFDFCKR